MIKKNQLTAYICLFLGVTGFSIKSIFIKLGYLDHVSTNALFILRMGFSLPFFLLFLLVYIRKPISKINLNNKQTVLLLGICSISYYISSLSDMWPKIYKRCHRKSNTIYISYCGGCFFGYYIKEKM
jgi:drug/metabolite transporter (DMT)-like permease